VVATGCEQQRVVGIGPHALHPFGDELGVHDFLRAGAVAHRHDDGVFRVRGIDRCERTSEELHGGRAYAARFAHISTLGLG
jgi:hypothetical protein